MLKAFLIHSVSQHAWLLYYLIKLLIIQLFKNLSTVAEIDTCPTLAWRKSDNILQTISFKLVRSFLCQKTLNIRETL
jgi:hypothetical protein